jgi:hypothetical protein
MANINIYWIKKNFIPYFLKYLNSYFISTFFEKKFGKFKKCMLQNSITSAGKIDALITVVRFQKVNG